MRRSHWGQSSRGEFRLLEFEENYSYKIIYSRFCGHPGNARISLISLVGAGRFERPTPCAQGRFRPSRKTLILKPLRFKLLPGPC